MNSTRIVLAATAGFAATIAAADCVHTWDTAIGQPGNNGVIDGMVVHNDMLYVGGEFTQVGNTSASRVARWDGAKWHALGAGVNGAVRDVTVYNNEVIAIGGFWTAGGDVAPRVARWDGAKWHAMGDINAWAAQAGAVYKGDLYVGGELITMDGQPVNNIARWDGKGWHPVGGGMSSPPDQFGGEFSRVFALTVYDDHLIAGGQFVYSGGVHTNGIARWDGSQWQPIGAGFANQESVRTMLTYNGQLVVAGQFTQGMDGTPLNYVARWAGPSLDDGSWQPMGQGMSSWVNMLAVHDGVLYAGGLFTMADGQPAERIARWNEASQSWEAVPGGGVTHVSHPLPSVRAIDTYQGELYVSGIFDAAGGSPAIRIAKITGCPPAPSCPGDLTGSGSVGVPDLLALLAAWGPCPQPCAADLTGSGSVGVPDLLALLSAWGPCP